jgi:hypothetical protein
VVSRSALAFIEGNNKWEMNLSLIDSIKKESVLLTEKRQVYGRFSISPSGEKVAVEIVDNQLYSINIFDIKRGRFSSFSNSKHNYARFGGLMGKIYTTHPIEKTQLNLGCLYMTSTNKKKRRLCWMEKQWV